MRRLLLGAVIPVLFLAVWEGSSRAGLLTLESLSRPSDILAAGYAALIDGSLLLATLQTCETALLGLAIAAVLPRSKELDRTTLAVVISVTTLSTVAMLVYPLIARAMALPPVPAGLFIGATIHDVAQVVVAGYALGPLAGDTATIVKLCRVALLAAVVFGVSCVVRRQGEPAEGSAGNSPPLLPWFLVLFFAIVALNSTGAVSPGWRDALGEVSRTCLLLGVAALGMKSSFMQLARAGWRPLLLVLLCTLWLAGCVLAAAVWMAHGRT